MSKFLNNYVERLKASFIPQVDEQARIAMDGSVCTRANTANGKEWIAVTTNGEKISYPEEFLMEDVPVFTIAKTIDQIKVGDVVKATSSTYAVVEKIVDDQIHSTTVGGNVRKNTPVTDFLTKQKTVRVVVNPFGVMGGQMDPNMMMMMFMSESGEQSDMFEIMMLASCLNGNNQAANPFGNLMANPMLMFMMSNKSGSSMKDFLIMQMLSSCGVMTQKLSPASTQGETQNPAEQQ